MGTLQSLVVSSGTLQPAFDPAVTDYTVTSLNALYPISVTATSTNPDATISIRNAPAQSGAPLSFTLNANEDFAVVIQTVAGPRTYTVHYLPPDLAAYRVSSSPGAGSERVLLTANWKHLLMVDRKGAALYYRTFLPSVVEDFKQHILPDGTTIYSTWVGAAISSWSLGIEHLMDSRFQDIGDLQLLPHGEHAAFPAEAHDFKLIDRDHYVIMSDVQRTADLSGLNPSWSTKAVVMDAVVQEVDGNNVLFEWDSANVPALHTSSVESNSFASNAVSDYVHLNSIDIDPADGNFIFSLRHTDSIVKVDRQTANIVWTLGGRADEFGLPPDQLFSHQHYARVQADHSITVFDNGNNAHQTRIVSFVLDEVNKKVTAFQVIYTKPADQPQTSFMGSSSSLGGARYLFGWGGWTTGAIAPAATEVADGTPVWTLTFAGAGVFSYRAVPIGGL
jgi:hypothetical protein